MRNFLKNEKGAVLGIFMGFAVVLVSMVSCITFMSMIQNDSALVTYSHDLIQQELFLRSEAKRATFLLEVISTLTFLQRNIKVEELGRVTYYDLATKISTTSVENIMGMLLTDNKQLKIKASSKHRGMSISSGYKTPYERLAVIILGKNPISQYQWFTDKEESENTQSATSSQPDYVRFWGADEFWGPVHSNEDIYMISGAGGWPIFNDIATTHGVFMNYRPNGASVPIEESGAPIDDVFRGGYEEEVPRVAYDPQAMDLKRRSQIMALEDNQILYIKMQGASHNTMVGTVSRSSENDTISLVVHDVYPDTEHAGVEFWNKWPLAYQTSDDPPTFVNIENDITLLDTHWATAGSIALRHQSLWVNAPLLWIEGEVSGFQTIGCSGEIHITNDITYSGTAPGQAPDGRGGPDFEQGLGEVNRTDMFGLVSEGNIRIKYKQPDVFAGLGEAVNAGFKQTFPRISPNVENNLETVSIMLYGAFAAIGDGDPEHFGAWNSHFESRFDFEYQHPHGSTPNAVLTNPITGVEENLLYIDLHKFILDVDPKDYGDPIEPGRNLWRGSYSPFSAWRLHGGPPLPSFPFPCGFPYENDNYAQPGSVRNKAHPEYSNPDNPVRYTNPPYGTDFPWYNPVWPESAAEISYERGTIQMFGAIAQTRRGFVHRSGGDDRNHWPNTLNPSPWDMAKFMFDGRIGRATGYGRDYHYDDRLRVAAPPNFPEVYNEFGVGTSASYNRNNWYFMVPSNW